MSMRFGVKSLCPSIQFQKGNEKGIENPKVALLFIKKKNNIHVENGDTKPKTINKPKENSNKDYSLTRNTFSKFA